MNPFELELEQELERLRSTGLRRMLRRVDSEQAAHLNLAGRKLVNFSSNDYLGLAAHPAVKAAAIQAVDRFGAGSGASRLICGSLAPFHELEECLAAFKGVDAALTFSTGYAAALGTITALIGKSDILITDKLVHACVVDAARLCGATLRIYAHNDLDDLEAKLRWAVIERRKGTPSPSRVLIVTESIFSMDGDAAPLSEIVALKEKYGAWLMVDEAHATGIYGPRHRGLAEALGVNNQIEIQMGTLGKAVGASGGYICGSRQLVDTLINRARSFIFSTAPVPAAAAAATAGLKVLQSPQGDLLNQQLWHNVTALRSALGSSTSLLSSAILPIIIGDETKTLAIAASLLERGLFVPAIRYPTVARGTARLRVTVSATHTHEDLANLIRALKSLETILPAAAPRLSGLQ